MRRGWAMEVIIMMVIRKMMMVIITMMMTMIFTMRHGTPILTRTLLAFTGKTVVLSIACTKMSRDEQPTLIKFPRDQGRMRPILTTVKSVDQPILVAVVVQ